MYVATHDAVSRVLAEAFGQARGSARAWYLEPETRPVGLTGAELEAELDAMALRHPGRVH